MTFTNGEKRVAAEREVKQRRRVYSRMVSEGRMKKSDADRETAIMEEIAEDYAKLEVSSGERLI